ncbi:signal peptidase I [Comamonas composti]|uniref:signal peptidase I n=1 Tax=Comamonas composti TaxID=408558 RepID=UPI00042494EA|nr:signal peptidase I [Comamonas composti]
MQAMQWITAAVLAAFVGYIGAWYMGAMDGNFALLLFLATVVTGGYWIAERLYFLPRRRQAAEALEQAAVARRAELDHQGIAKIDIEVSEQAKASILMQPWWLDWTAGLFPVIAVVFLLRSFLFEPFKIPSGSMIPTLLVGDLILVNKFTYGVRLPVINKKVVDLGSPERGDVMVFRYPPQPSLDYIKRVIGVPGDEVAYLNKRLTINGQPVAASELPDFLDRDVMAYFKQFEEKLGDKPHRMIINPGAPAFVQGAGDFAFKDHCRYSVEGVSCKVPEGHYFVMGDNRDNSLDSRYWGFVPDENIVGKAFFVWMNFGDFSRIGGFK